MRKVKKPAAEFSITFTGDRRKDRFRIHIRGKPVDLSGGALNLLVDLAVARGQPGPGYVQASRVDVCRLRRLLDKDVQPGTGRALVETGTGEEYRLTIPRDRLKDLVAVTPCFFDLVQLQVVTDRQAGFLKYLTGGQRRRDKASTGGEP